METNKVRRYTSLASVIDTLVNKRLVLLSPKLWDDRNDAFYIEEYRRRRNITGVLAVCMTEADETYHHWRVFAGLDGACIVFRKKELKRHLVHMHLKVRSVIYKTNDQLATGVHPEDIDLPFLKRYAFRDEREFRIIYENILPFESSIHHASISTELIDRIVLSPWTPRDVYVSVKGALRNIEGCANVQVTRSSLVDNETWQNQIVRLPGDL